MRVAVYNSKSYDKEWLNKANHAGKHELVFFPMRMTAETVEAAKGFGARREAPRARRARTAPRSPASVGRPGLTCDPRAHLGGNRPRSAPPLPRPPHACRGHLPLCE